MALLKTCKNIAIIGMPGSGKTTISREISKILGKKFVDIDEKIIDEQNTSIEEIFEKYGENYFRKLEVDMIQKVSNETDTVISTGGGCVLNDINYENLKKNSILFYIKRPLEELSIEGRPLSKGGITALKSMFEVRENLYKKFSDYEVDNIGIKETAEKICDIFKNIDFIS